MSEDSRNSIAMLISSAVVSNNPGLKPFQPVLEASISQFLDRNSDLLKSAILRDSIGLTWPRVEKWPKI